jgi:hypothetical protein
MQKSFSSKKPQDGAYYVFYNSRFLTMMMRYWFSLPLFSFPSLTENHLICSG